MFLRGVAQDRFVFSGLVKDKASGEPIDYAAISVDKARYGTLSQKGVFRLTLPRGRHTVLISHLGYTALKVEINLDGNMNRTFELMAEEVVLDEVIISSDGRDPAYAIIQAAIDRKKQNAIPFPSYNYEAYTKAKIGFQDGFDFDSLAKVFVGTQRRRNSDVDTSELENLLPSNILFLSENVSRMYIQAPNKTKEEILSTRVSGASEQFSPLGNSVNRFDVYENRVLQGGLAERGIISPLSNNSFFYYRFKLLGQIDEQDQKIYKILIIPKRNHDPVFQGLIYIADSSYAVQKLDVFVSKAQAIQVVDTLRIQQEYREVNQAWIPLSTRTHMAFNFKFLVFDFPIIGTFTSLLSDFEVSAGKEEKKVKRFNLEQISFADTALNKSRDWWDSIRPLPLTETELLDYQIKDSIEVVQNSPEYLDSLNRAETFDPLSIITGGTIRNHKNKTSWRFLRMGSLSGFNAIEGAYLGQGIDRIWDKEGGRSLKLGYRIRYGFGNKVFGAKALLEVNGNPRRAVNWGFEGGNFVQQFSRPEQINMNVASFFASFFKRSHPRLYRKQYVEAYYKRELFNGFQILLNGRFEDRSPLVNSSDFSLFFKDRVYTPNLPIPQHQALITEVKVRFKLFNRYMTTPDNKVNLGSAWPLLEFVYDKAWSMGESYSEYERAKFSIYHTLSLGILGNTNWRASVGKYFNSRQVFTPDLFHFQGNEVYVHDGGFDEFFLMPYYKYSTLKPFFEGHIEHAFGGFIFNKIPGIRNWKLSEYVGLHFLSQEGRSPYLELNAGLEKKIFKVIPLRVDFNMRLLGDTLGNKYGFKIYDPGIVGNNGSITLTF